MLCFNNNVDASLMPNQASVGQNYQPAADGAPGNTVIHRKGVITRVDLQGNLTASRTFTFGSQAAEGWLPGDVVFVQFPTHTGNGFTMTGYDIAGSKLCTWAPLLANGGMFVFGASTLRANDFAAVLPGTSTT
jgi:hypothetical protein